MNILVCIKQVPASNKVEVDPVTGVLKRDGALSKLNPYDLYALETGLRLKEAHGGEMTVVTMGPPQAKKIIHEAYAMGADKGVLLSDRRFAGADVLATSYALSQCVKRLGHFDLILCGKQTTDGDTAQVGPAIAEWMGIPSVSNVTKIIDATSDAIEVEMDMMNYTEISRVQFPCLLAVDKDIFMPRLPSYVLKKKTEDREITVLSLDDMADKDEKHYGLNGSPTQVARILPPESNVKQEMFYEDSSNLAEVLFGVLAKEKFL